MEQQNTERAYIDYSKVFKALWGKRRLMYKVWGWTFILACIWILPQPRYYTCEVKLAPELNGEDMDNGFTRLASQFGFNMMAQDAIYPMLYPELFGSPEFIVGLYGIRVTTRDGELSTDYYTYMKSHQKQNPLAWPLSQIKKLFATDDTMTVGGKEGVNAFMMSRKDYDLMSQIMKTISCSVDKKTNVITINVTDQDPLVCATMADSVKAHLQSFIIRYRTSKAAEDLVHYQQLRDSIEAEYIVAMQAYGRFSDAHRRNPLQSFQSEREKMGNDLTLKRNSLAAIETQLQTAKVKLQEKTPAFTTLKSAIVPVKPAGPKRMIFVALMMILATIASCIYILRIIIKETI